MAARLAGVDGGQELQNVMSRSSDEAWRAMQQMHASKD
jgi:hypothetical protein